MQKYNKIIFLLLTVFIVSGLSECFANPLSSKDERLKESQYQQKVQKAEEKENYERKVWNMKQSGYMLKEDYESLSKYVDKSQEKPKPPEKIKQSNMKYVPEPTYKIVRYNDPPGSPELHISKKIYKLRQYNGQGITAPDFSIMAYPVVYYYADNNSMASDVFVIPLEKHGTPMDKMKLANVSKRLPEPIVSTDKSIDNSSEFRSLTPIDFSNDSTKLLIKEKIGSSADGIWKTNAIVYDFENETSYNLVEVRDAIAYYWKENHKLNLDESMWDIVPLGFEEKESDRVIVCGYAYTGKKPVFLGMWSIDSHGEQSRLVSLNPHEVTVSTNGFKLIQDGVVNPVITKQEEKGLKKSEKMTKKNKKNMEKFVKKQMKEAYKERLKVIDEEYQDIQKDLKMLNKIEGSTEMNDIPKEYVKIKTESLEKEIRRLEQEYARRQREIEKINKGLKK